MGDERLTPEREAWIRERIGQLHSVPPVVVRELLGELDALRNGAADDFEHAVELRIEAAQAQNERDEARAQLAAAREREGKLRDGVFHLAICRSCAEDATMCEAGLAALAGAKEGT